MLKERKNKKSWKDMTKLEKIVGASAVAAILLLLIIFVIAAANNEPENVYDKIEHNSNEAIKDFQDQQQ